MTILTTVTPTLAFVVVVPKRHIPFPKFTTNVANPTTATKYVMPQHYIHNNNNNTPKLSSSFLELQHKSSHYPSSATALWSNKNDNDDDDAVDNFDGQGFATYLAPYALALLASIGVTFAFVKYVLMDF